MARCVCWGLRHVRALRVCIAKAHVMCLFPLCGTMLSMRSMVACAHWGSCDQQKVLTTYSWTSEATRNLIIRNGGLEIAMGYQCPMECHVIRTHVAVQRCQVCSPSSVVPRWVHMHGGLVRKPNSRTSSATIGQVMRSRWSGGWVVLCGVGELEMS